MYNRNSNVGPRNGRGGNRRYHPKSPDRVWAACSELDNLAAAGSGPCLFVNQNKTEVPRLSFVLMYGNSDMRPAGSHIHVSAHYTVVDGEPIFRKGDYNLQGLRDATSLVSMVPNAGTQTVFFGQPFDSGESMVVCEIRDLGAGGRQFRVGLGTSAGLTRAVADNWMPVDCVDQCLKMLEQATKEFTGFLDRHIDSRNSRRKTASSTSGATVSS